MSAPTKCDVHDNEERYSVIEVVAAGGDGDQPAASGFSTADRATNAPLPPSNELICSEKSMRVVAMPGGNRAEVADTAIFAVPHSSADGYRGPTEHPTSCSNHISANRSDTAPFASPSLKWNDRLAGMTMSSSGAAAAPSHFPDPVTWVPLADYSRELTDRHSPAPYADATASLEQQTVIEVSPASSNLAALVGWSGACGESSVGSTLIHPINTAAVMLDVKSPVVDASCHLGERSTTALRVKSNDAVISLEACSLTGPGLEGFIFVGDEVIESNSFTLSCKDDNGEVASSVHVKDVSVRVHCVVDLSGHSVSASRTGPGLFTCAYAVDDERVSAVVVDVSVSGDVVSRCPVTVVRSSPPAFANSTVMSCVSPSTLLLFTDAMGTWIPGVGAPILLFRMSRDGTLTSDFHSRCDGKASTITLVKSDNGFVFGGYTGGAWGDRCGFVECHNSFLFTASNPHGIPPTRYPVTEPRCAIYGDRCVGPYFGANGLRVGSNGSLTDQSMAMFNFYSDTTGKGASTFTGAAGPYGHFIAAEVEVWQLPHKTT